MDSDFSKRAKEHWTPEREAKVTGGKRWPVMPGAAPELLRSLGLLNKDSSMPADAVRKFSQINHMVTLILPQLEDLAARHAPVKVLDACCGTSYLTFLVAWVLRERFGKEARVIGVDANAKVIETSKKRAAELGMDGFVKFVVGSVDGFAWDETYAQLFPGEEAGRPHLLIALHACDTATDAAIACGIKLKSDAMALAPCCQAELARKWKDVDAKEHAFFPVFHTPNLRRETAAQITDAMRLLLIRGKGYEVTATEFVPSAHTPKNRLLLCTRRGSYLEEAQRQYMALKDSLAGQGIKLEELLVGV